MRTLWISTSTLACLIPLTFLCWRNSVRLGDLRAHNGELAARMAATGWVAGNRPSDDSFRTTSHHRPDASVEAKQVAADVIAYGRGLPLPPDLPERERTRRIAEHSRRIAALDDQQLEILIAELWATPDLDEAVRSEFIGFAAECLLRTHPRKAVAILISHFEEGKDSATPHWAIREWSRFAPEEALAWVRKNEEPAPFAKSGKLALAQDPATAAFMADWLLSHPDCPQRMELIAACVPLAYDAKPETAMRLVSMLPGEQDRLEALRRIHKRLSDWGSKDAAEAFAKEHGIKE